MYSGRAFSHGLPNLSQSSGSSICHKTQDHPRRQEKRRQKAGRLGDVTKLLQTQRRGSHWHMQNCVNGGAFPRFSEEPTRLEVRGYHFLKSAAYQSPLKNCCVADARKKCDTIQSNNFGVSRKRFKPSTPGSAAHDFKAPSKYMFLSFFCSYVTGWMTAIRGRN